MRKVLFDNLVFDLQYVGGISKQIVNLAKNLKQYEPIIGVEHTNNIYLKEYKTDTYLNTNNTLYSLYKVSQQDYDIFHPTYFYTLFLNYIGNKPFVLTIHDMIIEKFSDPYNLSTDSRIQIEGKKILSLKCDKIITVSECSKKDIIDILKVDPNKISVCYNGTDENFGKNEDTNIINEIAQEYILYVGTRGGTKNFNMLYEEYKNNICKKYPNLNLVLVGPNYTEEEKVKINQDGLINKINIFSGISEEDLSTLYKHAKCFIFPSLYEGFGIPIVEAFMCKCPVLLNRTSCFPEIGKDAALYFDLTMNKNNFMKTFDNFMHMDNEEVKKLINKGLEYSKEYTWQKFAEKAEKVYDEVIEKRNINKTKVVYDFVKLIK